MDKSRPPVKRTTGFVNAAFNVGLSPAHTLELEEYVQSHQSEGAVYAELEGQICMTLAWQHLRVLYIVSVKPAEITLVGLSHDTEPPAPPGRGKFRNAIIRSLLVHVLIQAGKKISDIIADGTHLAAPWEIFWHVDDGFFEQQGSDLASPRSRIIFQYEERSDAIGGLHDAGAWIQLMQLAGKGRAQAHSPNAGRQF